MITKSNSYKTEDGQLFASENEAKLHELGLMLKQTGAPACDVEVTISVLNDKFDAAVAILTGSVRVRGRYKKVKAPAPATTDKTKP